MLAYRDRCSTRFLRTGWDLFLFFDFANVSDLPATSPAALYHRPPSLASPSFRQARKVVAASLSTLDRSQAFFMTVSASHRSARKINSTLHNTASQRMSAIDRGFGFHVRLLDDRRKHTGRGPTYPISSDLSDPFTAAAGFRFFPAAGPAYQVARLLHRLK
jgi:hypothetical protein